MSQQSLKPLQIVLGHTFADERLLVQALTHSSLAHEQAQEAASAENPTVPREQVLDNERLEFLGDAVLGMVVAETLFRRFPELGEGEWTRLRASLVSRRRMAEVASAIELGPYLHLGRGEERSGGRTKAALLANSLEAVLAAIYLDGGIVPVERFVARHMMAPYLNGLREALNKGVSLGDHKSALQEMLQAQKAGPPKYVLRAESGPDHRKRFLIEVRALLGGSVVTLARGIGTTKKRAEQEAARRAFDRLRKRGNAGQPTGLKEGNGP